MENDIETIFSRQAEVLPTEVRRFVASGEWERDLGDVAARFGLSEDNTDSLRIEIALVFAGLVHPDEFRSALASELEGLDSATLDALASEVEANIFAPVRPMLERFFAEQEETGSTAVQQEEMQPPTIQQEVASPPIPPPVAERMRDVAPDNLPTGEIQSQGLEETPLMPTIKPKTRPSDDVSEASEAEPAHPFEEKMKNVFTGGGADISNLALPPTHVSADPYRELIE